MKYKLGDLIDSISDTRRITKKEVVLINTSDVLSGKVLNHSYVPNTNLRGQFKKRFQRDDILYSEIRPGNRRFAFVNFDSEDYIASTKLMVLRRKNNIIENDYLYLILSDNSFVKNLQFIAEQRSGTFPQITFTELSNIEVDIPDTKTQKKIIKVLYALDRKIELNERINQSLYDLGRILFDNYERNIDNYIKASEKLLFEKGIEPGSKHYFKDATSNSIRFIRVGDMLNDEPENYIDKQLCQNSILLDSDVAMSFDATIGRVSYGISGCFSSGLKKVSSLNDDISNAFIYYYLTSTNVQKTLLENATGTTILHAGKAVEYFRMPYDETYTKTISKELEAVFNKQLLIKKQNRALMQMRDALLPRLMSGEINLESVSL